MYKEMETRIAVLRIYWITLIYKIPRFVTEVRSKKGGAISTKEHPFAFGRPAEVYAR